MTLFEHAQRYVGEIKEIPGAGQHPLIQWWLSLCGFGFDAADEISWCSAFVNGMEWDLRLPRSKSALARSNLGIGQVTPLELATPDYCVAIFKRGNQPWQGHVGIYAGHEGGMVSVIGGNQSNQVTIASFPAADLLGIRRMA